MMKQLKTKKKACKILNLSRLVKLKKQEKQIFKQLDIDLNVFEDKIFTSRRFSSIQKKHEMYPKALCFASNNQVR